MEKGGSRSGVRPLISQVIKSESMRIGESVEVVPFACDLHDIVVANGAEVGQHVVVGDVDVGKHRVEAEVKGKQLVVGNVDTLQEILVGKAQIREVIPFQIDDGDIGAVFNRESSQVVVGSIDVVDILAV